LRFACGETDDGFGAGRVDGEKALVGGVPTELFGVAHERAAVAEFCEVRKSAGLGFFGELHDDATDGEGFGGHGAAESFEVTLLSHGVGEIKLAACKIVLTHAARGNDFALLRS